MATAQETLDRVRATIGEVLAGHQVEVYLYGSWVHGQPTRTSDIDVGVLASDELPPDVLARLREALADSHVPYPVDVVDLRDVDEAFRRKVVEEGVRWNV